LNLYYIWVIKIHNICNNMIIKIKNIITNFINNYILEEINHYKHLILPVIYNNKNKNLVKILKEL